MRNRATLHAAGLSRNRATALQAQATEGEVEEE